jgi:hypothetical protein
MAQWRQTGKDEMRAAFRSHRIFPFPCGLQRMMFVQVGQMIAAGESRQRKVRTPPGSMPRRKRGGVGRKPGATESVAENKPPEAQAEGKGEKAG